ncbi:multidrug and toxin extrusion protein [Acrasis kona]|uniref:Multidrug and toxin extrusion protein n=1 Tax=Acrasis kona TaxID=1008807 RepID=A0AAW2ZTJ6_9EUKA
MMTPTNTTPTNIKNVIVTESKEVAKIAFPVLVIYLSMIGMDLTDFFFIGRLGDSKFLAASALANTLFMALISIPYGMVHAQDTLVSQAHGANNKFVMKSVLCRSIILCSIVCIPLLIVFIFSNSFFKLVVKEEDALVADYASLYIHLLIPGVIPNAYFRIFSSYLVAQEELIVPIAVGLISLIINALLNLLLVTGINYKSLGFTGAPIATSLSRIISLVMIVVAVWIKESRNKQKDEKSDGMTFIQKITTIIKDAVRWSGIKHYIVLAIPSVVTMCLDFCCFQIVALLSSRFGEKSLSACNIILQITMFTYMFPFSISSAATVLVGRNLGGGQPKRAKYLGYITIVASGLIMSISAAVVFGTRSVITYIWSDDLQVHEFVIRVAPVISLFQLFDGVQVTTSGVLRGMGRQQISAVVGFFAYYVCGLPLGCVLAFVAHLDLVGLWVGLATALFVLSIILFIFLIIRVNWEKESEKAINTVKEQQEGVEEKVTNVPEITELPEMSGAEPPKVE